MDTENTNTIISDAQEYLQMGQTLLGAEKYEAAIDTFNKALLLDPMNLSIYMSKGLAYANLERFKEAKECFQKAVMVDKDFAPAYFQIGNIDFINDNFDEGLENYNHALALGYNSADLYYNLGLVYEEKNEPDKALRYYTKACTMDKMNPVYMISKASLQIMIGKFEEALQTLEHLRDKCPESFDGYHLTAAAYSMLGKFNEAEQILKFAQNMFPDDKDILLDHIRVLVAKGDLDTAVELIDNEIETSPSLRKELLLNKAQIFGQREQLEEANKLFLEALQIQENEDLNPEIRYFLINSYLILKDYDNMLKIARQFDRDNTQNPYNLCGMFFEGIALKYTGDKIYTKFFQDAVKYYQGISMRDPSRIDAYLFRAMCYKELGNIDKALETVDYVLLLQPENGQIHYIKGNLLKEVLGRETEAAQEYKEAKRLGIQNDFLAE